tara:strand:+ start:2500 stop:2781 length:282 start_codon:yes stop_codon:yes gene_type:complete
MAHWVQYTTAKGCRKQKMEYGYVDGVYTHYAVSGSYPCDTSRSGGVQGPDGSTPQALKRTEIYIPEQKNVERVNYLLISVIIVFVGLVIYKIK